MKRILFLIQLLVVTIICKADLVYDYDDGKLTASVTANGDGVTIPENTSRTVYNSKTGEYETKTYRVTTLLGGNARKIQAEYIVTVSTWAFDGSETLESITFGESLETIEDRAFQDCINLKIGIRFPKNLRTIGLDAFRNVPLKYVDMQKAANLVEIGERAFCQVKRIGSIESLSLAGANSLKKIGKGAFMYNFSMNNNGAITMPPSLETVEDGAFSGCAFQSFNFNNVKKIGISALANCPNLTEVTIKENGGISDKLFEGCSKLERLQLPEMVDSVGLNAFYGCKSMPATFIIKKGCREIKACAFAGSSIENVYYQGYLPKTDSYSFSGSNVKVFEKYKTKFSSSARSRSDVELSDQSGKIEQYAFAGCVNLKRIPEDIDECGYGAFYGCGGLSSLTFPKKTRVITENYVEDFLKGILGDADSQKIVYREINNTINERIENDRNKRYYATRVLQWGDYSGAYVSNHKNFDKSNFESVSFHENIIRIESSCLKGFCNVDSLIFGREDNMALLPDTQTEICSRAFAENVKISNVVSFYNIPPILSADAFPNDVYEKASLTVPQGTENEYRQADGWKLFKNINASSGIVEVNDDNLAKKVFFYNIQGQRVDEDCLIPGIYVRVQGQKKSKMIIR